MAPDDEFAGGGRVVDLEAGEQEDSLELAGSAPAAAGGLAPTQADRADVELQASSGGAGLALDAGPDLAGKRAARREAKLEQQVAGMRQQYRAPPKPTALAREMGLARWLYGVVALAVVAGAAYWYCQYRVSNRLHHFYKANAKLRDLIMGSRDVPGPEDVRNIVMSFADRARCTVERSKIEVIAEPAVDAKNFHKLDSEAQTQAWVSKANSIVGYKTQLTAKYGVVSEQVFFERFVYLHDYEAPPGSVPVQTRRPRTQDWR